MNGAFVPGVGTLCTDTTYLTLNKPTLFSAHSAPLGDLYFVSYAGTTEGGESWLLTRVSGARLAQFEAGEIDIRDMFERSEAPGALLASFDDRPDAVSVSTRVLTTDELLPYLPAPGVRRPAPKQAPAPAPDDAPLTLAQRHAQTGALNPIEPGWLRGVHVGPWQDVGGAAARVMLGRHPGDLRARVAVIEKTPRVRTGTAGQDDRRCDHLNWLPGPRGDGPDDTASRAWCDAALRELGATLHGEIPT